MVLVRDFILANVRRRLGTVQAHGPLMHGVHLDSSFSHILLRGGLE